MGDAGRRRAEDLFEAALDLPRAEREQFLAHAAGDDGALAAQVRTLLRAHDRAEGLLDRELSGNAAALLDATLGGPGGELPRHERIGPYRVLDVLGRGGMGVVYLAERADGQFRQRVAIKLIRGDGDPDLPSRIIAERQILATLDHPNIAKLLDGGVTDDGRPYLVMEHVAGLPIDTYCDRMRLTVAERLRLFVLVARAVDHAHRNLIVHRDLKPSNILVTTDGRPKLLDFGIAKLLNPMLAGVDAPVTRTEHRVLTPEYASPEQLRDETLTTASDVYSLGVVLYRLLTGQTPYRVTGRSTSAVLAAMLEEDPERPSSRIVRGGERLLAGGGTEPIAPSELARDRGTTPDRLRRRLRGDIDAIVLKALRKEPPARYGSAEQLAQDIEGCLDGRPVLAHRGSRWYHARKTVQRHRTAAIAAALVAVSLVLGAGGASWQADLAGRERDRANAALTAAEQAARQSEEVADFLIELFRSGDPSSPDAGITAHELLRRGVRRTDALASEPTVQARMLDVLGQMHQQLGEMDDAERLLARAVALRREHRPGHPELAEGLIHLSWVHRYRAHFDLARPLVEEALAIRRASFGEEHPEVADALAELGWLTAGPEQEELYRQALAIYEATEADPERHVSLYQQLSTNLRRQGRFDEAVEADRRSLALAEERFGPEHAVTGYAMVHLADHVRDIERDVAEAERLYLRGLELLRREHGPRSTHLMHGVRSLSWMYSELGRHQEAEQYAREGLAIRLAATGPDHPNLASEWGRLSDVLRKAGRLDESEALARQAIEHWNRTLPGHPVVAGAMAGLAGILFDAGRIDEAVAVSDSALRVMRAAESVSQAGIGESLRTRGRLLVRAGRFPAAEESLLESLAIMRAEYPDSTHPNLIESKRALSELYIAWERPADADRFRVPPGRFVPH